MKVLKLGKSGLICSVTGINIYCLLEENIKKLLPYFLGLGFMLALQNLTFYCPGDMCSPMKEVENQT